MDKRIVIETPSKLYVEDSKGNKALNVTNHTHTFREFNGIDLGWDYLNQRWGFNDYRFYLANEKEDLDEMLPVFLATQINPDRELAQMINLITDSGKHKDRSDYKYRSQIFKGADALNKVLNDSIFKLLESEDESIRRKGLIRSALMFHDLNNVAFQLQSAGIAAEADNEFNPQKEIERLIVNNSLEEAEVPDNKLHYHQFTFTKEDVFND